ADAAPLLVRQHVDARELNRLRRSAHELRKTDDITTRFGDEDARSLRRKCATQALQRVPAVEQATLDFIRNDAGVGNPPRRPGDGLPLREIPPFGSPDDYALNAHIGTRYHTLGTRR